MNTNKMLEVMVILGTITFVLYFILLGTSYLPKDIYVIKILQHETLYSNGYSEWSGGLKIDLNKYSTYKYGAIIATFLIGFVLFRTLKLKK